MIPDRNHQVAVLSELYEERGTNKDINDVASIEPTQPNPPSSDQLWSIIEPSAFARNTVNPIRRIVDAMSVKPNPDKPLLKLHIGDPTVAGVLPTHEKVNQAVLDALVSGQYNGYGPAVGFLQARQAVAQLVSSPNNAIDADDIILTSGCSHGLEMAIEALAESGANILVPKPGFPLYETLMHPLGIETRHYNLVADQNWEIDLNQMESLIDSRTAAIIVNNPNNPTGAVYSRLHLEEILKLAFKYRIPIIADEIYGDMVFGGAKFHPLHTLEPKVPMITCDGISKRYLVPGWRLGWLIVHDVDASLAKVRTALCQLAQKIVGPCSLMQGALPAILGDTPMEFFQRTRDILSDNVDLVHAELALVPGLTPIRAQGAMYMMVKIDPRAFPKFGLDDLEFAQALISEESLYCLPGSAFYYPGAIRFVMTQSRQSMKEACDRLRSFCARHYHPIPSATEQGERPLVAAQRRKSELLSSFQFPKKANKKFLLGALSPNCVPSVIEAQ